ncbi:hypothetical protein H072_3814 [Dactylellina haptotyla CBS 200.50]|uniref:Spc7 kinetochore protein domain-containing protein n=1 Tax=Dactylellina haptotyla (strain CBS 200.50) TaxID=1284197 RepID=S8AG75_DACHA|nr:hypothetical protein H072_3814 [Dactylellina haptotyla CBS 200.50]
MSDPLVGRKRGSRKSIAFQPSSSLSKPLADDNKENGGNRAAGSKKSRSKSLGPGELQRLSAEEKPEKVIKSILQPAIPISPLQQIPSFNGKAASKIKVLAPPILVPLKTELEQQQARQQREAQRSAAMSHRENRRKSLGGRRVSFNPEVTMHVLEELRVSNTPPSIESNTTKAPGTPATPAPANNDTSSSEAGDSSGSEQPATPEKQLEHSIPEPESARLEHKKENRRPMTPVASYDRTEEFTSSPTPSSAFSSPGMTDEAETTLAPEDSSDEDDTGLITVVSPSVTVRTDASDDDSDDMDLVDDNEVTATFTPWIAREHNHPRLSHPETGFTSAPPRPQDSNPEMPFSGRRHDHPRLSHPETGFSSAPRQAELMRQENDEDDATMEITRVVGKGVLASPSPARISHDAMDDDMTMEFTQAIGPGILGNRRLSTVSEATDDEDMTMEITRAIGPGLLSARTQPISYPTLPRFSHEQEDDDQTMELTRAIGGIKSTLSSDHDHDDEDEEMSMELTKVIGGVLASRAQQYQEPEDEMTTSMDMDMTVAIGGIIQQARLAPPPPAPPVELTPEPEPQSPTINTDLAAVTMSVNPSLSALVAEARARSASVTSTPPTAKTPTRGRKPSMTPQKAKEGTPKTKDATPKSAGRVLRSRTTTPQVEAPPAADASKEPEPEATIAPEVSTPKTTSKAPQDVTTPQTTGPATVPPKKTATPKPAPTPKGTTPKTATPRRHARTPIQQQTTPTPKSTTLAGSGKVAVLDHGLSAKRRLAGIASPGVHLTNMNVGLKSPSARATGVGISKAGMGSPSVRKILSARKSLGIQEMEPFSPGVRPLSQLLKDLNENNKQDDTDEIAKGAAGIKEMLVRMTPKKSDKEKEQEKGGNEKLGESSGRPKRTFDAVKEDLKAAAWPTPKNLQEVATGSPARKKRRSLEDQTAPPTPVEKPAVRFNVKEVEKSKAVQDDDVFAPSKPNTPVVAKKATLISLAASTDSESMDVDTDADDADVPKMAMKEFLNMVGISFMDGITSTRHRRQTGAILGLGVEMPDEEISIADQINGQLTIRPFLELYEHLQRELKRSNKEGKEMFKQIEKMVLEENPRLFREYVLAPPDVRAVMDLQFKNIKSSSRLEARGDWYTWRRGLQETIMAKAQENLTALKEDGKVIEKQREIVDSLEPVLTTKHKELTEKVETLRMRKEEIEGSDPKELEEKRAALVISKKKLEEKKAELEKMLKMSEELEGEVKGREERRERCLSAIEDAEKVAEANKGHTEEEVVGSIERVRELQEKTGWMLKKAESPFFLVMVYKKTLQVRFNAQQPGSTEQPVTITLLSTVIPTVQQEFFVEAIQASARDGKFGKFKDMLKHISERWDRAVSLIGEIQKVAGPYPNRTAVNAEKGMVFTADMLVMEKKAKVRVNFKVSKDVMQRVEIRAETVYGEGMSGWKLDEYLERVVEEEGKGWKEAMRSLRKQLASGK